MLFPSYVICCFQLMSFACVPWLSGRDHATLCLQQAVILGVLSFFMAWVVQAFFASVLLDIVNAGMPTSFSAVHCSPLQSTRTVALSWCTAAVKGLETPPRAAQDALTVLLDLTKAQ